MNIHPSYDKFIFSEDKRRLFCQLVVDKVNDNWSYSLFPLPNDITSAVFDKVEGDFDEIFYNPNFDIGLLNYGNLMNLGLKIESAVMDEMIKYPYWCLPDYLTSYSNVDIDAFEDWKASFFNPKYIRSILIPNRIFDKTVNYKIDKDIFFIINILRVFHENNAIEIVLKSIDESIVLPFLSKDYAEIYFQKTLNEGFTFNSIDSYSSDKDSNDGEIPPDNPIIFAVNSAKELEFCVINIPNKEESDYFKQLADYLAQNLFMLIDR